MHDERVERLLRRCGCTGSSDEMKQLLDAVGRYRLRGYIARHQTEQSRKCGMFHFVDGVSIAAIKDDILLDRRLRVLMMDAVERIELALRSLLCGVWTKCSKSRKPQGDNNCYRVEYKYLPTGGKKRINFAGCIVNSANQALSRCTNSRIKAYCRANHIDRQKGRASAMLPLALFLETISFGTLVMVLQAQDIPVQKRILAFFGFEENEYDYFMSLLELIREARNKAAHHARIWDIKWRVGPIKKPGKKPRFGAYVGTPKHMDKYCLMWDSRTCTWSSVSAAQIQDWEIFKTTTCFLLLTCGYFISKIDAHSLWTKRVESELKRHKDVTACQIVGFPEGWNDCPTWYN